MASTAASSVAVVLGRTETIRADGAGEGLWVDSHTSELRRPALARGVGRCLSSMRAVRAGFLLFYICSTHTQRCLQCAVELAVHDFRNASPSADMPHVLPAVIAIVAIGGME